MLGSLFSKAWIVFLHEWELYSIFQSKPLRLFPELKSSWGGTPQTQTVPPTLKVVYICLCFTRSLVFSWKWTNPVTCPVWVIRSRRHFIIQQIKRLFGVLFLFFSAVQYNFNLLETIPGNTQVCSCSRGDEESGTWGFRSYSKSCCCNWSAEFDLLCQTGHNIDTLPLNWWQHKFCWIMNHLSSCRKELKSHIELIYKELAVYLLSVQLICHF